MKLGITMLIHNKDDIEFVTEFPCFLGHTVYLVSEGKLSTKETFKSTFIADGIYRATHIILDLDYIQALTPK